MTLMKKITLTLLALGIILVPLPAAAQFRIPNLTGSGSNSGSNVSNEPVTDFYAVFLAARVEMNQSQLNLAQAFDLQEQVALLEAEQVRLAEGNLTASDVKDSVHLSNSTSEAIDARIHEGAELSEEGRQFFIEALPHLIAGTLLTIELPNQAESYADQLRQDVNSAGYVRKAQAALKLKDGIQITQQMPGYLKTTATNYRLVIGYGQDHSIPIPDDATDVLGSL
ncbi:MAG: hypothetical protein R3C08_09680 [Hyphomonas sp.]